jgi:hypothetical protein
MYTYFFTLSAHTEQGILSATKHKVIPTLPSRKYNSVYTTYFAKTTKFRVEKDKTAQTTTTCTSPPRNNTAVTQACYGRTYGFIIFRWPHVFLI